MVRDLAPEESDGDDDRLILTAAHLFLPHSRPGDFVCTAIPGQLVPATSAGRVCGTLRRTVPLVLTPHVAVDAAVIKPHEYVEHDNRIGGSEPTGICDLWSEAPDRDIRVVKHGARTGLTRGTLTPVAADHVVDPINLRYTMGWWVDGEDGQFADEGDSGSAVVDEEHRLVGMAVAIKTPHARCPTFVHGVRQIFAALKIALY